MALLVPSLLTCDGDGRGNPNQTLSNADLGAKDMASCSSEGSRIAHYANGILIMHSRHVLGPQHLYGNVDAVYARNFVVHEI